MCEYFRFACVKNIYMCGKTFTYVNYHSHVLFFIDRSEGDVKLFFTHVKSELTCEEGNSHMLKSIHMCENGFHIC